MTRQQVRRFPHHLSDTPSSVSDALSARVAPSPVPSPASFYDQVDLESHRAMVSVAALPAEAVIVVKTGVDFSDLARIILFPVFCLPAVSGSLRTGGSSVSGEACVRRECSRIGHLGEE